MATYQFSTSPHTYADADPCVVLDSPTLSTLAGLVPGWSTTNATWGQLMRQGSTGSFVAFANGVATTVAQNGQTVTAPSVYGPQCCGSTTLTVTTLGGAAPTAGDFLLVAVPGTSTFVVAQLLSVSA